jgi:hypothetical protein
MKNLSILFIIIFNSNLIAQNEKLNRDALTIKLEYEQQIGKSLYFIKPNTLQIFPSEELLMEVEIEGESIRSMKIVKENFNPNKTIIISFSQKNDETNGKFMMLDVKNPFNKILSFEANILTPGNNDWTKTSILPIQAQSSGIEIWHDAIVSIVMENWKIEPTEIIGTEYTKEKNKNSDQFANEKTLAWIKNNNIDLNKLPFALEEEINYTCDSSLYLKQIKGDTIIYWAYGWQIPIDTIQALEWVKQPSYGKTSYIKMVNENGTLESIDLTPHIFKVKNDSIFELEQFYNISNDSLIQLFELAYLNLDEEKNKFYENIIEINSYKKFKLIYHPNIFNNGIYERNCNKDKIKLVDTWDCNSKKYFAIEISNYRGYGEEWRYTLVFDENFKWLEYDGCDQYGIDCMKKRNFEVHYR